MPLDDLSILSGLSQHAMIAQLPGTDSAFILIDTSGGEEGGATGGILFGAAPGFLTALGADRRADGSGRGGTGAAKTGGNYAAALQSAQQVQRRGYDQSLWLDPVEMKYIEELSGMNFFILQNGELHTPILNGSFLAGITRDSLITLAKHKGITVIERDIAIQEVLNGIETGAVSEIFACGTAAIVSPVSVIADADGSTYNVANVDQLAAELRQSLLAIQEGREADPFSWTSTVKEAYYPNV